MLVFELVIALLLAGAGLTVLSKKLGTPYPALVALAGAGLALLPWTPEVTLEPDLALTLFVAPVLLDAAFDSSPRDLRKNWRSVVGLALGAVVLTIVVVAFIARTFVPTMPWAVAIALGAIVAPPDAAAATAVLKQLRPPHRLLVILEGESLFNDASALLVFRTAVGVVVAGSISPAHAIPSFLLVTVGSVVLGLVLSRVVFATISKVEDIGVAVVLQFCGGFAIWIIAERLHLSGVLTMVVFAMAVARRSAATTPARQRIPSFAVWTFAVFVLNVLAFILVGFQLKAILRKIDRNDLVTYLIVAGAVCGATMLARIGYVVVAAAVDRWRRRLTKDPQGHPVSAKAAAVVGWCGMRGIVTLASALALPETVEGGAPFPHRDLVIFIAFGVVLGTLVLQGTTLSPLLRWLRIEDDGTLDREVQLARVETLRAAVAAAEALPGDVDVADLMRRRYAFLLSRAEQPGDGAAAESDAKHLAAAMAAERKKLIALRDDGTIGDAAFQRIEEELDWEELYLERVTIATSEG